MFICFWNAFRLKITVEISLRYLSFDYFRVVNEFPNEGEDTKNNTREHKKEHISRIPSRNFFHNRTHRVCHFDVGLVRLAVLRRVCLTCSSRSNVWWLMAGHGGPADLYSPRRRRRRRLTIDSPGGGGSLWRYFGHEPRTFRPRCPPAVRNAGRSRCENSSFFSLTVLFPNISRWPPPLSFRSETNTTNGITDTRRTPCQKLPPAIDRFLRCANENLSAGRSGDITN